MTLVFDRAVDVSGYDGAAIVINDPVENDLRYDGQGGAAAVAGQPAAVKILLANLDLATPGPQATLDAGAGSGIVAQNDGGAWAGVAGLALPFP